MGKLSNIDSSKTTKNKTPKKLVKPPSYKKAKQKNKTKWKTKKRFLLQHFVNYYICEKKKGKETKKLRRKQKDLLLNIIIIMLTFARRNFFRRKEILQKPRSNQNKSEKKSEAYLKEIPRLFIHYCGKM